MVHFKVPFLAQCIILKVRPGQVVSKLVQEIAQLGCLEGNSPLKASSHPKRRYGTAHLGAPPGFTWRSSWRSQIQSARTWIQPPTSSTPTDPADGSVPSRSPSPPSAPRRQTKCYAAPASLAPRRAPWPARGGAHEG